MKVKKAVPTEAEEQTALFLWAEYAKGKYPELELLYHVPNGGSRNSIEAANLKKQGVKAGVPDIHLPVARRGYHALYIELKRQVGGVISDNQKRWIFKLNNEGNYAVRCDGWEKAKNIIEWYLGKN